MVDQTESLTAQAHRQTAREFALEYSCPFLLVQIAVGDEDSAFMTMASEEGHAPEFREVLAPIRKRQGANAFSYISVGRSSNNDIVIHSPQVSKCHFVFERRDGQYSVTDMGSKNGTLVNGKPLSRHQTAEVDVGAVILFGGSVTARILDANAAYHWLSMR